MHGLVRVVVLVVTISLTLVLLPIAINVGTGGVAPEFLNPYVGWTWPLIGVLWLVAIITGLAQYRSRRTVGHSARSADQPRNRPNALARIDRYLADRFTGSLASQTRLALALMVAQGIRFVKALPMDHLVKEERPGDSQTMDKWTVAGALAGLLVAAALGANLWWSNGPEAVLGIIAGTVASKAWRRRAPFFAGGLSRGLHGFLLRWSGYLPWRRGAFLRYAAARFVLAKTGRGEYAFIHLLVRDHLAECDPDALAAKVDQRIAARAQSNNLTRSR